jgi:hypothetical protein
METRKSIEDKAQQYADGIEIHPCAYRRGLKQGFIEGYQQALRQTHVRGIFSEAQMRKAWEDGAKCEEQRGGSFDIENFR